MTQAKYPPHIRTYAERMIKEKSPTIKIIAAINSEFSVEVAESAVYWWRKSLGLKAPKSASRKAPVGQTAASVDEGAAKRVAEMMVYMKPNNDGRRLGAPV